MEKKIQDYMVAGHGFRLCMDEDDNAWGELQPYSDFRVSPQGSPLFCVELMEDAYMETPLQTIWKSNPDSNETRIDVYTTDCGWIFDMAVSCKRPVCGHLVVSRDFTQGRLYVETGHDKGFCINNALMLLYAFTTASLNTLEMHASVVMNGGYGYLFLGKSGTGKSTHSRLWLKHIAGCELLNDDNPIVKVEQDGTVRVYGSPWSGKTPCYRNLSAPVGGFVDLKQAPHNEIRRLSLMDSFTAIYVSCSGMKWDKEMTDGQFDTFQKIIEATACYGLECLPDEEAARLCADTICIKH